MPIGHHHTHADTTGIDEEFTALETAGSGPDQVPQLATSTTRFRSNFAYVDGMLTDGR